MGIRKRTTALALTALIAFALVGCGSGSKYSASDATVKSTPRSLAAAAIAYLGQQARFAEPTYYNASYPKGAYGTEVHLSIKGQKYVVSVMVSPGPATHQPTHCPKKPVSRLGCTDTTLNGHKQILSWELVAPEEDPGIVGITSFRPHEVVNVTYWGPDITKSPLKGGIPIDVRRLERLAASPVVGFKTTPAYVKAGNALKNWRPTFNG